MSFEEGRPIEQCFDYQEHAILETIQRLERESRAWEPGRGIVLRLPTGAGKTVVAVEVLLRYALDRFTVIWISHMSELLDQAEATLRRQARANTALRARLDHVRISQEDEFDLEDVERHELVFVTDAKLAGLLEDVDAADLDRTHRMLVVIDEAHRCHEHSLRYTQILETLCPYVVLGLTATPPFERPHFAAYWNARVVPSVADYPAFRDELERDGFLARLEGETIDTDMAFEIVSQPVSPEIYLTKRVGDFADDTVAYQVAGTYLDYCEGKTLIFAVTIEHAEFIVELLVGEGVAAAAFHGGNEDYPPLTKRQRREILTSFRQDGGLDVLVSVQLAAQGVDLPEVRNLILARPTFSSVLYGQMLGRGRRGPMMGGTEVCHVFDLTWSFVDEHGRVLPVEQRTHKNLDLAGDSDERIRAAIYVGGNYTLRQCAICDDGFLALKAPHPIPFRAAEEWVEGNLEAAKIFDWPAHVAWFRDRWGEPFACRYVDSASEAMTKSVTDGRTARAWSGGVARIYYLPQDDD